jgi:mycofactocin glycosyltransferase
MSCRPPVSVIVPFLGTDAELEQLIERLAALQRGPGDQLIVADNRPDSGAIEHATGVTVRPAGGVSSPGFARNRGAAQASGEWLVFIDADTEPEPRLLDSYFEPLPASTTAILGGGILDVAPPDLDSVVSRYAVARGHMGDAVTLSRPRFPYAQSANCAIRREVFAAVGGFAEGVRAGEDADLCFRLSAAGWELEERPAATVRHRARGDLRAALTQLAGHGAGAAWCERRHPGSFPRPTVLALSRRLASAGWTAARAYLAGDRERASFAALDVAEAGAFELGRLLPNTVRRELPPRDPDWRRPHRQSRLHQ